MLRKPQGFNCTCGSETSSVRIDLQSVVLAIALGGLWLVIGRPSVAQTQSSKNPAEEERNYFRQRPGNQTIFKWSARSANTTFTGKNGDESVRWLTRAYALSGDAATGYDLAFALMQAGELDQAKQQIEAGAETDRYSPAA